MGSPRRVQSDGRFGGLSCLPLGHRQGDAFCDRLKLRAPSKFFLAFRPSLVERIQCAFKQIGDIELVTQVHLLV